MKRKGKRRRRKSRTTPEEILLKYMGYIQEQNYTAMYQLIDVEASRKISEEDFVKRNSAIYEGIEVQNMAVTILSCDMETLSGHPSMPFGKKEEKIVVQYQTDFGTVAGEIRFENEAYFLKTEDTYKLVWMDSLIYPGLSKTDKVRVSVTQAKRGEILDRNGKDIKLTIDAELQEVFYEQFQSDKSCSVAMNPYTGEVLALVSTPSYDNNDFIMGLSDEKWAALNEDENKPMYNLFGRYGVRVLPLNRLLRQSV